MASKDQTKVWPTCAFFKEVQGIPLLEPMVTHWKRVETFRAFPDDLLIATYPKAGTTWIQEIVDLILSHGDPERAKCAPTYIRMPFLEMTTPDPTLSVFKSREGNSMWLVASADFTPCGDHAFGEDALICIVSCEAFYREVICVARNPNDTVLSYFHFDWMNRGPWPQYLDKFMKGQLGYSSWYDHVQGYWREREKKEILFLFYEGMEENPAQGIRQIADLPWSATI